MKSSTVNIKCSCDCKDHYYTCIKIVNKTMIVIIEEEKELEQLKKIMNCVDKVDVLISSFKLEDYILTSTVYMNSKDVVELIRFIINCETTSTTEVILSNENKEIDNELEYIKRNVNKFMSIVLQ